MSDRIFISLSSADRGYAERIISFLESHDLPCWIAFRDVPAGENYQEAITRALRAAREIIVIISRNANQSVEITKELSLASRYKIPVVPLRVENVEPNDALAYELATRQWVDLFENWNAGCQRLVAQLMAHRAPQAAAAAPRTSRPYAPAAAPRPAAYQRPSEAPTRQPPSRALSEAIAATAPRRRVPAGTTVVHPRSVALAQPAAPREASVMAPSRGVSGGITASPPPTAPPPPPAAPAAVAAAPAAPAPAPARDSRVIATIKFLLVAVVFGVLLGSWILHGEPSPLELFFWAILLIGCARLLGTALRAVTGGLRPKRA